MKRLATALALTLVAGAAAAADAPALVKVPLRNASGADVGEATLTEAPNGVVARLALRGLTPGWHALHFHEKGDCSKSDFTSAGGHVHDKATLVHGLLNPDANDSGDLPNIYAAADGAANAEVYSTYVTLESGSAKPKLVDSDGSAIVVHASADDHRTQPIGGAGARVACGVIAGGK